MNNNKIFSLAAITIIIILGFGVYANSIHGDFVLDDIYLIRNNLYVKNWSYLHNIFTEDWGAGGKAIYSYYRPLTLVTHLINYSLSGLDVRWFHLTTIMFHVLAALTIYWFITILYDDRFLSLLTSALFVVHPVHTEAVAFISGRVDSMALVFMLLAFIFYIKRLESGKPYFLGIALLSYGLALLTKEGALILPALVLLYHYAFRKKIKIDAFMWILGVAFFYILLRLSPLISVRPKLLLPLNAFLERAPGFFIAMVNYIRLLILPFDLHMDYGARLFDYRDPKAILGFIMFVSLLVYAFKVRNKNRFVFFSIAWFFIALLPVSNLGPLGMYMAEHYLYLPSLGFFLLLGRLLRRAFGAPRNDGGARRPRNDGLVIIPAVLLIGFYSFLTIRQNDYWREAIPFYERTLAYNPDSVTTLMALGNTYTEKGEYGKAILSYERAINANPENADLYNNLGYLFTKVGRHKEAMPLFKKAVELRPDYADAYVNLGSLYALTGNNKEAIGMFKKAIELMPKYALAHNNLASAYYFSGQYEEAIRHRDIALSLGYPVTPELMELLIKWQALDF